MTAIVFGKMPAHGDFIARGLPSDARAAWDAWLTAEMQRARTELGDAFEAHFDSAPVWRFADGEHVGAIAPSVDAVGRRFPLLAACAATGDAVAQAEACEHRVYDALAHGWTADRLHAALSEIGAGGIPAESVAAWWTTGNESFGESRLEGARPRGLLTTMLTPRGAHS